MSGSVSSSNVEIDTGIDNDDDKTHPSTELSDQKNQNRMEKHSQRRTILYEIEPYMRERLRAGRMFGLGVKRMPGRKGLFSRHSD